MAVRWTKVATDLGVGGTVGVASRLVDDWDEGRAGAGFFTKAGTYLNYGLPILGIVGAAAGFLRGEWETRVLSIGGVLAGRGITAQVKERTAAKSWMKTGSRPRYPAPAHVPEFEAVRLD